MKSRTMFFTLAMTGLLSVFTLSSFYKPDNHQSNQLESKNDLEFEPLAKQQSSSGRIGLSSAFENEYYTNRYREGHYYIELKAGNQMERSSREVPMNLSVVIDRSGSMAGTKIRNAKQAAKQIIDQMSADDYVSIVIYDGSVEVLQSSIPVANKQFIKNKIDGIVERGGTNLMGGALEGYAQVKRHYDENYINRVLLLSDGLANEGITDPHRIKQIVQEKSRSQGISISTFGIGRDYNEDLMTSMAENGTGNYYFIDRPDEIAGILKSELNGLSSLIAQGTQLNINIPSFVNIMKVYGHQYQQQGRNITVHFHDIFANETKGILIKYRIEAGHSIPVNFNAQLNYKNAEDGARQYLTLQNRSEYTSSEALYERSFSDWVATQVALYESNEQLESAMREVDKGNYDEARKIVKKNEEYIKSKPQSVQSAPAVKSATIINAEYESKLDNVESMSLEDVKFLQKDSKNSNYKIRNKK